MSLIAPIHRGIAVVPRRSFITTGTFHTEIFRYTTALSGSFQTVGTLTTLDALGTGTAVNCPVNRVLRENGRVIAPDAHPVSFITRANGSGASVTTTALTLQTVLVGVYDANSGLSGFIDPNSSKFQLYNGSKANFQPDGINPVTNYRDALLRSFTTIALTPVTVTDNVVSFDANLAQTFTITPTATINTRIAATAVPAAGLQVFIIITVPATPGTCTVNFGTGSGGSVASPSGLIRESATVTLTGLAVNDSIVVSFISNGSFLIETSRSATDLATLAAS